MRFLPHISAHSACTQTSQPSQHTYNEEQNSETYHQNHKRSTRDYRASPSFHHQNGARFSCTHHNTALTLTTALIKVTTLHNFILHIHSKKKQKAPAPKANLHTMFTQQPPFMWEKRSVRKK